MGVINQSRYYCIIVPQPTAPISIMICKLGEFQVGWNVQLSMTMKLPARYIFNSILKIAFWNNNNICKQVIPEMTKSIRCTCVHLRVPFDHRRVTKSSRLDENYANETRGGGGRGGWPIDPSIKQSTKCGNAVQSQSSIIPQNKTQHDNILSFSRRNMEIVDIWVASDLQRAKRTANAICRDTRGKKGRSQVFPFFERRAAIGRRLGDRLMDPVTSLEEGAAATESFGLADLERGGLVFVRSRPFRESRWFFL